MLTVLKYALQRRESAVVDESGQRCESERRLSSRKRRKTVCPCGVPCLSSIREATESPDDVSPIREMPLEQDADGETAKAFVMSLLHDHSKVRIIVLRIFHAHDLCCKYIEEVVENVIFMDCRDATKRLQNVWMNSLNWLARLRSDKLCPQLSYWTGSSRGYTDSQMHMRLTPAPLTRYVCTVYVVHGVSE